MQSIKVSSRRESTLTQTQGRFPMLESLFRVPKIRHSKAWISVLVAWLLIASAAFAQTPWVETDADSNAHVHLYFFWSETCPHCLKAHPFIEAIPNQRPWVIVHSLEISRHRDNTQRFIALAESLGQTAEAVPTLIACGVMETGWEDAASTGVALLQRLDQCRSQVQQGVTPGTLPTPEAVQKVRVPLLGEVTADQVSLPVFTLVLAGLDAFNPCAFLSSCFC